MSKLEDLHRELDRALREGIPKRKRPSAEVIPLPQGPALELAKATRTRASDVDRAVRQAEAADRNRIAAAEALVNSPEYAAAGARFNREHYFGDPDKDGPCHFNNPGGWR
jgi:hypothetical protein